MSKNEFLKLSENNNIALSLEGGGARGAYQVGALKALFENNFKFKAIVGTSIGCINAAYISQGEFSKLYEMWQTMSFKDLLDLDNEAMKKILDVNLDKKAIKYMSKKLGESIKNGGLDVTSERRILEKDIDEDKIRNSDILFGLVTMCVSNIKGEELFIDEIPNGKLIDYIMASSNLPIFKRVVIDDKKYLDGGAWDNCPVHMLEKRGFTDVIVIRAHKKIRIRNYKKILKRGKVRLHMISPVDTLPSILNFDSQNLNYQIKLGYYDTLKLINNLDGIRYYIARDRVSFVKSYLTSKNAEKISDLLKKLNIKMDIGENVYDEGIEKIILKLGMKTKNKDQETVKDAFISILEEIAILNGVERFKIYTLKEFVEQVKKCEITKNRHIDFKEFIELL